MMYFAAANADTNLALITILGTAMISLFALVNYLLKRSDKTIAKNTEVTQAGVDASNKLSATLEKLDSSIVEGSKQSREYHKEVMHQFTILGRKADRNYDAINARTMNVDTMHVKTENVETQNNA